MCFQKAPDSSLDQPGSFPLLLPPNTHTRLLPENHSLWCPLLISRRKWLHRERRSKNGRQSGKDLIRDTDRPSLGRAFPGPSITREGAFLGAGESQGRPALLSKRWLSVWALKSGRPGDRLPGLESVPASAPRAGWMNQGKFPSRPGTQFPLQYSWHQGVLWAEQDEELSTTASPQQALHSMPFPGERLVSAVGY